MIYRYARLATCGALFTVLTGISATAQSVEEFYKGKTVDLFVGSAPGGGYDTYARTISRHITRYIPGNPAMVVKNMPGASGLRLAGFIYNKADQDGSDIAAIHNTVVVEQLLGKKVLFDSRAYNWLGSANQLTSTCVARDTSGIKSIQDAGRKELLVGATGSASSSTQLVASFLNSLTGTKFKIIRGYPSSSSVLLAMERGEVGGLCGIGWDSLQAQASQDIKDGKVIVLVQTGMEKNKDLKDVPLVLDLAKTVEDRKVLEFLVARQYMGRPYVAPPGVPKDRVDALRKAFTATMNDPEFQTASKKAKVPLSPITGEQVQNHVDRLFKTPPAIIARANAATDVNKSAAVADAKLNWISVTDAKIDGIKKRKIMFMDRGNKVSANVRRAKIKIDGKKAKRKALKVGMTCNIKYLGNNDAAGALDCKS